jgi:hypothetical protein
MAWVGNTEQPEPPPDWEPLTQLLSAGLDLRTWYPEWAREHPPEVNSQPMHSGLRHVAEWTRYARGLASQALAGSRAVEVEVSRDAMVDGERISLPAGVAVSIVGQSDQGEEIRQQILLLTGTEGRELGLSVGRALASALDIGFRTQSDAHG